MVLFEDGEHRNILLEDYTSGGMVQANQHLVVHGRSGLLLDPGGFKLHARVMSEVSACLGSGALRYLFLSHQDPDIIGALNEWLLRTDADAYASRLWKRFIPHIGIDSLVVERLKGIPDEGMVFDLEGAKLLVLPAHFLHSCGNFHLYDPRSKILYSGDVGGAMDAGYREVSDFDGHVALMEGFHRRYMASNRALRAWVRMVRGLDVEVIAPQHGALFRGRGMVDRFLDWCEELACGVDLMEGVFKVPVG